MNPATATRAEIRDFVRMNCEAVIAAASSGESYDRVILDQRDQREAILAGMTKEQAGRFMAVHAEESEIASKIMLDKANADLAHSTALTYDSSGKWVFLIICFAVVMVALVATKTI